MKIAQQTLVLVGLLVTTAFTTAQTGFDLQNALPSWLDLSNLEPQGITRVATRFESRTENQIPYNCTIEDMSLTRTPEQVVTFAPDLGLLYPGNMLQGRSLGVGSLLELPVPTERRNGLVISTDLPMVNGARRIPQASLTTVRNAINEIRLEAERQGIVAPANLNYRIATQYNAEQAAVELGLDLRFLPIQLRANAAARVSLKRTTVSAFFIQRAFSVTVDLAGNQPARGLFAPDYREDEYRALEASSGLGSRNPPTYVSTVSYGRIMMFSLSAEASETDLRASIEAWRIGNVSGSYRQILQNAELQVTAIGGTEEAAVAAIRSANPNMYFSVRAPLSSMVPISYEIRTIKENRIAAINQTSRYSIEKCVAAAARVNITLESLTVLRDCDPGIFEEAGDFFFAVYVDQRLLFEVQRTRVVYLSDGQTLPINRQLTVQLGVGQSVVISGAVYEGDDSILGNSNTLVGEFSRSYTLTGDAAIDNRRASIRLTAAGDCMVELNFRFETQSL